jgi:hypothetical protein
MARNRAGALMTSLKLGEEFVVEAADPATGPETFGRDWIITSEWYASSNTDHVELWAVEHYAPSYAHLTAAADALQLAADQTTSTHAVDSQD